LYKLKSLYINTTSCQTQLHFHCCFFFKQFGVCVQLMWWKWKNFNMLPHLEITIILQNKHLSTTLLWFFLNFPPLQFKILYSQCSSFCRPYVSFLHAYYISQHRIQLDFHNRLLLRTILHLYKQDSLDHVLWQTLLYYYKSWKSSTRKNVKIVHIKLPAFSLTAYGCLELNLIWAWTKLTMSGLIGALNTAGSVTFDPDTSPLSL
jgi:hypothetical protein